MKPLSHIHIINSLLTDLRKNKGKVVFPGSDSAYGLSGIYEDIINSRSYDPFMRSGAIGPDAFPGLPTGQMEIHTNTDKWLLYIKKRLPIYRAFDQVHSYLKPEVKKEFDSINAFYIGYLSHFSADVWTHEWVNSYAKGAWPSFKDLIAKGSRGKAARENICIHMGIETQLDKAIRKNDFPPIQRTSMPTKIAVPLNFLFDLLINTARVPIYRKDHSGPDKSEYYNMRTNHLFDKTIIPNYWRLEQFEKAILRSYSRNWYFDVREGLLAWIKAHETAMEAYLKKYKSSYRASMFHEMKEEWMDWAEVHLASMLGVPDLISKIPAKIGRLIEINIPFIEKMKKRIKEGIYNYICEKHLGMSYKEVKEMFDSASLKNRLLTKAQQKEITRLIGEPENYRRSNVDYENPLIHNIITTIKPFLLSEQEQKRFFEERFKGCGKKKEVLDAMMFPHGIKTIDGSGQFNLKIFKLFTELMFERKMLKYFKTQGLELLKPNGSSLGPITGKNRNPALISKKLKWISVKVATADEWGAGVDGEIHFLIWFKGDTAPRRWELDLTAFDDFERGDKTWYHMGLSLPGNLPDVSEIRKIGLKLRKSGWDEWTCSHIKVSLNGSVPKYFNLDKTFTRKKDTWSARVTKDYWD